MVVRVVRPGEPFALSSFSEAARDFAPTAAVAQVDSEVLDIPLEAFQCFLSGNPDAVLALLATFAERLPYANERIRVMANYDAEDRVRALLVQLVGRRGQPVDGSSELDRLHFTHAELAGLSGLSRSHVSIIMGRLRDKGMIQYGRGTSLLVYTRGLVDGQAGR